MKIQQFYLLPLSFSTLLLATSCTTQLQKVRFSGQTQGTYYAITYFDKKGRNLQPQIDSILRLFDLSVSMWVPGSIISRINDNDSTALPDEWFRDIFHKAVMVSDATGGAFDFTVGPLVNAWGFGFKNKIKLDSAKVDSLRMLVDYKKVRLEDGKIIKDDPGMQFDFNAIAQGYAVDVLGRYLEEQGIKNYLVDIGGEVLGYGSKPGHEPWTVGIENPAADSLSERTINAKARLNDMALSTSGNYRKYYEENGTRYSHTIDPSTGYPVRHNLLSVSILADECATADGFATAFMVFGLEKSLDFLKDHPELQAYFIYSDEAGNYHVKYTEGFSKILIE
jgi:thiamine biosynthesis lipoprotein